MNGVKKIAVLSGGWSDERDVSIRSGQQVSVDLKSMGFDVTVIDVKKDLRELTDALYRTNPDYVFNMLHGTGGEDGTIQGILEIFGVPYSNSNVLSSAVCFNKEITKIIVEKAGVLTIPGMCITANDINLINNNSNINFDYPFIIKPANNGSSVGIHLVYNKNDLQKVQSMPWQYGNRVLIENYIPGREFTVLVINGNAIGSVEITYKNIFYDFEAKYSNGGSSHKADYELPEKAKEELHRMARIAYNACLCNGIARIDFRYDGSQMYFLEINTQPGMTATSLVPDILKANGLSMSDLWRIIKPTV